MTSAFEDKFAIEELIGRYNQSLDSGDYETWLGCWTDDAVFDGLGKLLTGIQGIRGFAAGYEAGYRQRLNGLKHFTVNIVSRIDGDHASSSSHLQLVTTGAKGAHILFTGRYEDELRREGVQWRFTRRKLHQDMPRANEQVSSA